MGIKMADTEIPQHVVDQNPDDLIDGEKWGIIKLVYIPPQDKEKGYIEMSKYKPFRPLERLDLNSFRECRKKFTKYVRNKQLGIKMPEDTDRIKYQSAIIHKATIAEDREKLWDNKKVWQALESKGFQIMSGLDVIEYTLKAGEKDRIIDAIDTLSGYESNIEEVAKN